MSHDRAILAAIGLALLAYVGGYLVLAHPARCAVGRGGGCTTWTEPNYRVGGEAAEAVFRPLERLDRQVRPGLWATRHHSYRPATAAPSGAPGED